MNETNNSKEQSINKAIGFLRSNRPLRAEELCRDYLILNPGCTEHLRLLSHALMKQKSLSRCRRKITFCYLLVARLPSTP